MSEYALSDPFRRELHDRELDMLLAYSQERARVAVARGFDIDAGLRQANAQIANTRTSRQNLYMTEHSVRASAQPQLGPASAAPAVQLVEARANRNVFAEPRGGPTVLRILLGAELRRLREARQITRETAGYAIRASDSKISRMELGRVGFKERDVADLLSLYGVTDPAERDALTALARQANAPGWWHSYSDVLPHWFEVYVGLEQAAWRIRAYEVQFVPGLLQTEDYARAVALLGSADAPAHDVERRVSLRMTRQKLLVGDDPPHLWVVVDEAALRRPLGGRKVMRAQLKYLIEATSMPNVTVQVVPFQRGGHAAAGGPFSILRFAEADLPDIVYLEQLTSALYLERREDFERYLAVMERLCLDAEPASATTEILLRILNDT